MFSTSQIRRRSGPPIAAVIATCVLSGLATQVAAQTGAGGSTTNDGGSSVWFSEPRLFAQLVEAMSSDNGGREGLYPELRQMITGAGWISAGPGYRQFFDHDNFVVEASAAMSWRAYKVAQARIEQSGLVHDRLRIGARALWRDSTQVEYYGVGPHSALPDRTEYRAQGLDVYGYARGQIARRAAVDLRGGWVSAPVLSAPSGPFRAPVPDARRRFDEHEAPGISAPSSYATVSGRIVIDTRDRPGYARHGGLILTGASLYSDPRALFSFVQYETEAIEHIPVIADRWGLALHGWLVGSPPIGHQREPFFLLPSLGGQNTIRGYADYRFHDRNLAVVNVESRFGLFRHLDAAVFADAGDVAARVRDLTVDKTSVGFGLRVHSRTAAIARLDVAHSREGWRVIFKLDDALSLRGRLAHTSSVPFVP